MNWILAIDPGTTHSGFVLYENHKVSKAGHEDNEEMLWKIKHDFDWPDLKCAIEMVSSYGMPVGKEVFETVLWTGRFLEGWNNTHLINAKLVYRKDVKMHLCNTTRAKDGNVRQALIDLFPATGGGKVPQIGTKKQPGPLYGVSSHAWPALGVAVTALARDAA